MPELSDEEMAAVVDALRRQIDADRFPLSSRLVPYKSALAKLAPGQAAAPAPEPSKPLTPPSRGARSRNKWRGS